ncbi:cytochrome P450 [Conidiobolus coronatus NRRL 28638]|uniref:Cytochrome P450 n=1 Tax=Conidiobolus coronatus (strain ATCC 28846 / CBS 209.66 / NRRL 28638) TaxID=796925 RepID=A0A137PI66_CONC2|nr:cytochrome P450 [Conidiobolus coronatus NRRL 28638]|eukprot:KXN74692.1 cytochrome P450 [Conidiobolus coronatus NRRL 28638]
MSVVEFSNIPPTGNYYLHAFGVSLLALIIYILYFNVIYPYYLGPLRNLPRPKNVIKYLYDIITKRIEGDVEHQLLFNLKYGPIVHFHGDTVLLNGQSFRKYWMTYKYKKSEFHRAFDIGGYQTLFSATEKDYHSKIKKLVLPAFSVKTLASVEKTVYDIGSQGLVSHIQSVIKSGQSDVFDLFHLFHCSTFDVITQLVFGTNFDTISDKDKAIYYISSLADTQKAVFWRTIFPPYKKVAFPMEKIFKPVIFENIKLRENNPNSDILQSLIDSIDPETGEKLTNEQIAVEFMTLLFGGEDTTANTLTWTLYELLKNPEIYNLVEKEILEEFPDFNESITLDRSKSKLKYLEASFLESMRMYPVAAGGLPRVVPEGGTKIILPIYSLHNDPKNWKNPKIFDIQRWLGEERENNKAQLMSFGAGPRSCIGRELAWNEMYLVLTNLIRNFRMELIDTDLTPCSTVFYKPKEMRMKVKIFIRK